jgi:hypothetical protein
MDRRHNAKIDYPALRRRLDGRLYALRLGVVEGVSDTFRSTRRWACSASHAFMRRLVAKRIPATIGDQGDPADPAKARRTGEVGGLVRGD